MTDEERELARLNRQFKRVMRNLALGMGQSQVPPFRPITAEELEEAMKEQPETFADFDASLTPEERAVKKACTEMTGHMFLKRDREIGRLFGTWPSSPAESAPMTLWKALKAVW